MKHLIAILILVASVAASCDNNTTGPPAPKDVSTTYTIRDIDYIKDKFFMLDDAADFTGGVPGTIQVYMSVNPLDLSGDPSIIRFPGWAIPDSTSSGDIIAAAVQTVSNGQVPPGAMYGNFRRLSRGTDFSLLTTSDSVVVGVEMKQPVPNTAMHALAVRYTNQLGHEIGDEVDYKLVMEMIKSENPRPTGTFHTAWRLAMRNAYFLGSSNPTARWSVKITDILNTTREDFSTPEGSNVSYLTIFGLDRHDEAGSGPPDGKIDNVFLGWNADMKRGILWMPALNAFAPPAERVDVWTNGAFSFTGPYLAQYQTASTIYTQFLTGTAELNAHQYLIEATATIRYQ